MKIVVCAFYKFCELGPLPTLRSDLLARMKAHGIRGSILLAPEGINATVSGNRVGMDALLDRLRQFPELRDLEIKESYCEEHPFRRAKVRLKKESITFGVNHGPEVRTGEYIEPKDWNSLVSDGETMLLDTRNCYEVELGTFQGAVDPKIRKFSELADYVEQNLSPDQHRRIATFCTGGIRCEKFSSYLLARGFTEVFQLKGGILKYLEEVPEKDSLWNGKCFVFDERVGVGHGLKAMPPTP